MEARRNTIQRQLVYDAVKDLDIHANAEQVYKHIITTHPSVSRATVYRNLNQLADSGEIMSIGNFYGTTHYDHNSYEHYHFICEKCKRIFDISNCFPDVKSLTHTEGLEIKSHSLSFSGLCNECK